MNDIWNPWHGCRKISEGCLNCYMFKIDAARGADGGKIYRVKNSFSLPLKKDRQGNYKIPSGMTIRVCMTSDFFLKEADEWRDAVWQMMRLRPDVHFWLLTKRASRIRECLPPDWGEGYENVSLNVSIENQKRADERLPCSLTSLRNTAGRWPLRSSGPWRLAATLTPDFLRKSLLTARTTTAQGPSATSG